MAVAIADLVFLVLVLYVSWIGIGELQRRNEPLAHVVTVLLILSTIVSVLG